MDSKDDNFTTPAHERLKSMMTVKAAAERVTAQGASITANERRQPESMDTAPSMVEGWSETPKMTAGSEQPMDQEPIDAVREGR